MSDEDQISFWIYKSTIPWYTLKKIESERNITNFHKREIYDVIIEEFPFFIASKSLPLRYNNKFE